MLPRGATSTARGARVWGELVMAPDVVRGDAWMRPPGEISDEIARPDARACVGGSEATTGRVLSDHADWPALVDS